MQNTEPLALTPGDPALHPNRALAVTHYLAYILYSPDKSLIGSKHPQAEGLGEQSFGQRCSLANTF